MAVSGAEGGPVFVGMASVDVRSVEEKIEDDLVLLAVMAVLALKFDCEVVLELAVVIGSDVCTIAVAVRVPCVFGKASSFSLHIEYAPRITESGGCQL